MRGFLFWSIRWTPQPRTGQELSPHRRPWVSEPWARGRLGVGREGERERGADPLSEGHLRGGARGHWCGRHRRRRPHPGRILILRNQKTHALPQERWGPVSYCLNKPKCTMRTKQALFFKAGCSSWLPASTRRNAGKNIFCGRPIRLPEASRMGVFATCSPTPSSVEVTLPIFKNEALQLNHQDASDNCILLQSQSIFENKYG